MEYFCLGDLWECYEEWSAYGVGVPIVLNNGERVTQYYVPYLSALEIFTNTPQPTNLKENEDAIIEDETMSKRSETEKSSSSDSNEAWDDLSNDGSIEYCESPSVHETKRLGHLYLKFCDTCSPYWRIPFAEKIAELAEVFPGLMTLKNIDLSPASWIAVAWYPIYHIPMKGNCKNCLSTCFLTYHTLSSSSQVSKSDEDENKMYDLVNEEGGDFDSIEDSLYPFGLATYRLEEDIWMDSLTYDDYETIVDLYSAADSWLKQLNFWHHDFNFFTSQFSIEGFSS
ncbi:unnamed protein product [Cuscuta campestris]|uniref:Uncharacterized protein n=1 Tax=Cuscuta campestris TaxID=132261 RepID=A0A484KN57_9ASTE|nr:unnamed protein product [Cuscuta campestris]VFQ64597.1 unnamed protein product [Cuscuta campestris]